MADFNGGLVIAVLLCCLYRQVIGTEYLNLAMNYSEVIEQSSTYTSNYYSTVAENAVDGFTDQTVSNGHCAHTNRDNPAWWRIQFKDRVYINRVVIYHRNEDANLLKRFRGSRVYVSENGECDGNRIYKQMVDPTNPWQDIFNITVNADGTYLVICNGKSEKSTFLQLCEVQVIGCPYGTYGDKCALTCGNCYLSTCDLTSGICPDGCDSQYMGPMCNTSCIDRCQDSTCTKDGCIGCVTGKHGDYCEQQCPLNCELSTCSQQNGSCNGCKNNKFWDSDCSNKCASNCNDTICNQDSGICYGCTDGFWGSWCNQTCHNQCSKNVCNQSNGNCSEECSSGYWGNHCEKKCPINCAVEVPTTELSEEFSISGIGIAIGITIGILMTLIVTCIVWSLRKRCSTATDQPSMNENALETVAVRYSRVATISQNDAIYEEPDMDSAKRNIEKTNTYEELDMDGAKRNIEQTNTYEELDMDGAKGNIEKTDSMYTNVKV